MKILNVLTLILTVAISAPSFAYSGDAKDMLFETLSPVIKENVGNDKKLIEYCPDNLCLLIEASEDIDAELLYEFAILFFFYKADFPEFRESDYFLPTGINPRTEFSKLAPKLLNKYDVECCFDAIQRGVCVIDYIEHVHGIKTYFTREDEGYKSKEELD